MTSSTEPGVLHLHVSHPTCSPRGVRTSRSEQAPPPGVRPDHGPVIRGLSARAVSRLGRSPSPTGAWSARFSYQASPGDRQTMDPPCCASSGCAQCLGRGRSPGTRCTRCSHHEQSSTSRPSSRSRSAFTWSQVSRVEVIAPSRTPERGRCPSLQPAAARRRNRTRRWEALRGS
jgi:hypothetical protein